VECSETHTVSADGLRLPGSACVPEHCRGAVLLVHGGAGLDRHEGGLFGRLAEALASAGFASFRFDHRAYISSKDSSLELSLHGVANDVRAGIRFIRTHCRGQSIHLCASSFGGGATVIVARDDPELRSLVLINPLVDYRRRLLEEKPFWKEGRLTAAGAAQLRKDGYLPHGEHIRMGRCLINEAAQFDPHLVLPHVQAPTLIVHGTADQRIPHGWSENHLRQLPHAELMLVDGADHGIAASNDSEFRDPRTISWHRLLFAKAIAWISEGVSTHAAGQRGD
jgi:pimeloyl-ACP methyl ester carboxylesterase